MNYLNISTEWLNDSRIAQWFTWDKMFVLGKTAAVALVFFFLVRLISYFIRRSFRNRISEQGMMLLTKGITYTGTTLIFIWLLAEMGVQISALLGAAGIVGIAVGVASQASLGNIISGLFLISEKPFEISDIITVGDKMGYVHSIDLLSIKIRTFDNLYIRIPNQEIISTNVTNLTRFPIRRMNYTLAVSYREDLARVEEVLKDIARNNPLCLTEPEPFVYYKEFGENGVELLYAVWFEVPDFFEVRNSVFREVHDRFLQEGIEFSRPHRLIFTGKEGAAQVSSGDGSAGGGSEER